MKVKINNWLGVASWAWDVPDPQCVICLLPFESPCPNCKNPGDDCAPVESECSHYYHLHCISRWTAEGKENCPCCRKPFRIKTVKEVKIILIPSAISKPVTSEAEAQPESPTESIYSYESFISQLDNAWQEVLSHFLSSGYFKSIHYWVSHEYTKTQCRPIYSQIFTAFNLTSFENIKIVIIGQEPYTGPNEAMGLSFSVPHGVKIPASLKNVFKSMQQDPNLSFNPPQHGDLSPWARQGVFLLNSVLTVRQGAANSHARKVWERFSDEVIKVIDREKTNVVFMLWGAYAQEKGKVVDRTKHLVLETCHPSPLSAFKGGFFEAHHFSKANEYLRCHSKGQIDWSLEY